MPQWDVKMTGKKMCERKQASREHTEESGGGLPEQVRSGLSMQHAMQMLLVIHRSQQRSSEKKSLDGI